METILIGYFPKKVARRDDWSLASHVVAICSVSSCITKGPPGWIEHWKHNQYGFFNSSSEAEAVVPESDRSDYTVFAYALAPLEFTSEQQGLERPIDVRGEGIEPLPKEFRSLGFDAVSRSVSDFYECSPLSCNGAAEQFAVNPYCLFDSAQDAIEGARRFATDDWEPGPYYVFEVFGRIPPYAPDAEQHPRVGRVEPSA